jgi:hypothetical protein
VDLPRVHGRGLGDVRLDAAGSESEYPTGKADASGRSAIPPVHPSSKRRALRNPDPTGRYAHEAHLRTQRRTPRRVLNKSVIPYLWPFEARRQADEHAKQASSHERPDQASPHIDTISTWPTNH